MDTDHLAQLLAQVQSGECTIEAAVAKLKRLPTEAVGDHALLDTHRELRTGAEEFVFCPGKFPDHLASIMNRLFEINGRAIATRATADQFSAIKAIDASAIYNEVARIVTIGERRNIQFPDRYVAVLTAGTADISVAEEAAVVLEWLGSRVERIYDVGVAGLHRLLGQIERVQAANVLIVVAGMEGALASVVTGLVSRPVVAVPTSVGYGASLGGFSALLSMLNSCAGGMAVVNIDNGFGAAQFAHRINSA